MGNLTKNTVIKSAVVALVLSAGIATTANAEVKRLSGADRYGTSDAIVKAGWPAGAKEAVLTSGLDDNTVDALTVAPFAKAKNAPVVLVNPKDSVETIVAKFTALNTKIVYIANGTGVISKEVEEALKAAGIAKVNRLGGINRYETALNIAKTLGASSSIVIASGEDAHLVDSLSIAPIAAAKGMPIFLAGSSLDADTTDYINSLKAKTTYVLGGTDTVSDEAVNALPGVIRLAGSGRYETNAKVVTNFKADKALNLSNIFIASGEDANLVDALAGSPLAGLNGAPIIFVHDTINPDINTLLKSVVTETTKIIELGGIGAVTQAAEDAINKIQLGVITFSDKNFEQAIRNNIKKPTGDILKSDVEKVKVLNCNENSITNIEGIENFTSLTELSLNKNNISSIEPLKALTNLTYLDLNNNQINNLEPLKGLTNLSYLDLSKNQINNLEYLSTLTKLTCLTLNNNRITSLYPIKDLTSLNKLYLQWNNLDDMHLTTVSIVENLRGLTNLTCLDLSNNNDISRIEPLKGLIKLTELHLEKTKVSNIEPLKGLINLNKLYLSSNTISNIEPLRGLTKLTELYLAYNQVSNLEPLKALIKLTCLDLNSNQIINIEPLKTLTKLTSLKLYVNPISDIDTLKALTNLTYLDLTSTKTSNLEPLKALTKLAWLGLASNEISNVESLKGLTNLTWLSLAYNKVINIESLKGLTSLTSLNLSYNEISNIEPLRALTNLTELYLKNNPIKDYSPVSSYYNNLQHRDFTLQ